MKRLAAIMLFLFTCPAFALEANLNGDCVVNFRDYAIFAADWQNSDPDISDPNTDFDSSGTVDIKDLAVLAEQWLTFETLDRSPVIEDESFSIVQGASQTFNITATDSESLTYSVESLPSNGTVYDSSNTQVSSVPYALPDNQVKYTADPNYTGSDSFTYGADDGTGKNPPCGGKSIGTASITVTAIPVPPVASDVNVSIYTKLTTAITLAATDDGWPSVPGKLRYIITSYPTNATLQDPKSGASVIDSNDLPYTLSSFGSDIWFTADTNDVRTFQFKANDGGTNANSGDSNVATVTATVIDHPQDSLSFDGEGYITFSDSNSYDIANGWAIDFWVKTRESFIGLIDKKGSGVGYEIGLSSGKPKFYLFDSGGSLVADNRSNTRVNDGQWHEVAFIFNTITGGIRLTIQIDTTPEVFEVSGTFPDFANADNLIAGENYKKPYRGDIDKIRFFSGITDPTVKYMIIQGLSERTESGNEVILGFGKYSDVLYMLDEGSGTTVTDSKLGLTGTLNDPNLVRWLPFNRGFADVSVQQHYRGNQ